MSPHYRWSGTTLILDCLIQPKASRDEFSGLYDDRLKIRIQSPPVDGKANQRLIAFLAKQLGVTKSSIKLISGETGRRKRIAVTRPSSLPKGLCLSEIQPPNEESGLRPL